MASINLTGVLRDPTGEFAYKNKIQFTHASTTGQTPKGFRSLTVIGEDGSYDIDVEYGNVFVQTWDNLNHVWINHGTLTINSDTTATDIPSLLGITTPASDADLLVFQALVADATSAKNDAETAQAATEALFNDFDDSVADSLAVVSPANIDWDVEISFNDSGEIEKGFGTRNTYGNKAVDFSRASTTGNINKSGAAETVAVDEIAIESDGAGLYGGYTNVLLYSEDFSNAVWTGGASHIESSIPASDSESFLFTITDDNVSSNASLNQTISGDFSNGCARYIEIMNVDATSTTLTIQGGGVTTLAITIAWDGLDISSLSNVNSKYKKLSNGAYGVWWWSEGDSGIATNAVAYLWPAGYLASGLTTGTVLASKMQIANSTGALQHIKTEAVAVTRAADVCSIPLMNNMPAPGEPFTIICDCALPDDGADHRIISRLNDFYMRRASTGGFSVKMTDASGTAKQISTTTIYDENIHRYAVVYDGSSFSAYVDGVNSGTIECIGLTLDLTKPLAIGSYLGTSLFLNSAIENLRIKHRALSVNEMAALGSAE